MSIFRAEHQVYVAYFQDTDVLSNDTDTVHIIGVYDASWLAQRKATDYLKSFVERLLDPGAAMPNAARAQWVSERMIDDGEYVLTEKMNDGGGGRQLVVRVKKCALREGT